MSFNRVFLSIAIVVSCASALSASKDTTSSGIEIDESCYLGATLVCKKQFDAKGKLNGLQVCKNQHGQKNVMLEAHFLNGVQEGKVKCWSQEGEPRAEIIYKNGKVTGVKKDSWSKTANKFLLETDYVDNQIHGYRYSFNEKGPNHDNSWDYTVRRYENGKEDGFLLTFLGDEVTAIYDCEKKGQRAPLEECRNYDHGKYTKALQAYFHKSESESKEKTRMACNVEKTGKSNVYIDGEEHRIHIKYQLENCKVHGLALQYFEGDPKKKYIETNYENGQREGEQTVFFREGQMKEKRIYLKDQLQKLDVYFQNGVRKIDAQLEYADEVTKVAFKEYDQSGLIIREASFVERGHRFARSKREVPGDAYRPLELLDFNSRYVGKYKSYHYSKKSFSSEEGEYGSDHLRKGLWTQIAEDGSRIEAQYKAGKITSERRTDKDGKVIKDVEYFPDGSEKQR